MKNKYLFCCLLSFGTYFSTAQTPTPSPDFWEKVETSIYGNKSYVPKKLEEIQTPNASFAISDNGLMLLTFGTFTGTVNQHFVSSDDGKTWKVLIKSRYGATPKFEPVSNVYSDGNTFISENHGSEREDCVIKSSDGVTWSKVDNRENYYRNNWLSNDGKIWKITTGNSQDIKHKFSNYYGKAIYYNADGTITVDGEIEFAPWNNSKKVFQRKGATASPSITIGQNGKIWKSCQGKYYYDNSPNGILYSEDDINYKPFITNLCEKGFSGYGDYGYQYENTNTPIFIYDKMFLNGWALNWKTTSKTSSLFFSEDSKNWKEIGLLMNAENVRYNKKTKRFYLYLDGIGLFQSKKTYECGCKTTQTSNNPVTYGTTIITHGVDVNLFNTDKHWTDRMAVEILKKAGSGNVYKYQPETGEYLLLIEGKNGREGEDILIFDWSAESAIFEKGFTEAAADALFTSLLMTKEKGQIELKNLHFIGHGRGCIVNSLAVERLLALNDSKFTFSQVTNLGALDSEYPIRSLSKRINPDFNDLNDAHPDLTIFEPKDNSPNNGVIAWKGIFSDSYYQKNGKIIFPAAVEKIEDKIFVDFFEEYIDYTLKLGFTDLAKRLLEIRKTYASNTIEDIIDRTIGELKIEYERRHLLKLKNAWVFIKRLFLIIDAYDIEHEITFSNMNSRMVAGTKNFEWSSFNGKKVVHNTFVDKTYMPDELFVEYVGICDAYIETIKSCKYGIPDKIGGYSYSRINGYPVHTDPNTGHIPPKFSFYNKLILSTKPPGRERIIGVMNGSFDRIPASEMTSGKAATLKFYFDAPGWCFHGGGYDFEGLDKIIFNTATNSLKLYHAPGNTPTLLKHNRFYVPKGVEALTFLIKTSNVKNGELKVTVQDVLTEKLETSTIKPIGILQDFVRKNISVKGFGGKVITVTFEFSSDKDNSNSITEPYIELDELDFSLKLYDSNSTVVAPDKSTSIQPEKNIEPSKMNIETNVKTGLSNGAFDTNQDWEFTGGKVTYENGMATLKPDKAKKPVILKHQPFKVQMDARTLKFLLDKSKVGDANFKIILTQVVVDKSSTIYSEEIRQGINKFNRNLENVNNALNGNFSEIEKKEEQFIPLTAEIQSFAGKVVTLEIQYETLGIGKPELIIDEISIE